MNEIFKALKDITGYARDPVFGPAKLGETRRIYLDANRARNDLGWMPGTTLEDGLRQTVEYFRARELAPQQVTTPPQVAS